MSKIFVDVGGHVGETVEVVVNPWYGFDRIYSFEPVDSCAKEIRTISDPRVHVISAGLSNRDHKAHIHNPGTLGGSLFADAPSANGKTEQCHMIEAARFFEENIRETDDVYLKLNCEGSEVDIVENLISKNQWKKVANALIDFDACKIPSQRGRVESVKALLAATKRRNYQLPEDYMYGTGSHFGGITNWLNRVGARETSLLSFAKGMMFHLSNIARGKHMGFYKLKILRRAPASVVTFYYNRIKQHSSQRTGRTEWP